MTIEKIFLLYITAVNLIAFALYGTDKALAKARKFRISEAALIWSAIMGGSIGAALAMIIFHHKTQKKKFLISIPVIILLQSALVIWFIFFSNIKISILY